MAALSGAVVRQGGWGCGRGLACIQYRYYYDAPAAAERFTCAELIQQVFRHTLFAYTLESRGMRISLNSGSMMANS